MKRYLLDTHVLLWAFDDPRKLSARTLRLIRDRNHPLYVSVAGVWEIVIKKASGRLKSPDNLVELLEKNGISVLPITLEHALAVADLPLHHHDPFDRMLVAQAQTENLTLVTRDRNIPRYDVAVLEA